jgi:para-aminobenzoate synthetase component 1
MSPSLGRSGTVQVHELAAAPRLDGIVDVDVLLDACWPADLLESADRSGWTYLVPHDLTPAVATDDGRRCLLEHADGSTEDLGPDPLAAIDRLCRRLDLDPHAVADPTLSVPFRGGLLGALAYELGDRVQPHLPRREREPGQLDLALRVVGALIAIPRERDRALVVVDEGLQGASAAEVLEHLTARCAHAVRRPGPERSSPPVHGAVEVDTSLPRDAHAAAVDEALTWIGRGDAYQVNLAQRLSAPFRTGPRDLYRRMRAASPASHAALLPAAGVVSVSPERFLEVVAGTVTTDPIKGTRPRSDDPLLDAALADDLSTSGKDRAENVMVVDLERNDLGRVCEPGSVHVPVLLELRPLPTVWHLVSSVRGTLRADVGYADLLRATFPSGSVTGAPRLAAMQAIRALEPTPRGWYCGAVGWLGRGAAGLSVAIRTATLHDGIATYGAGGGIVADSDPDDEVAESLDKAVAFLRAVGATRTIARPPAQGIASAPQAAPEPRTRR